MQLFLGLTIFASFDEALESINRPHSSANEKSGYDWSAGNYCCKAHALHLDTER